MKNRYRLALAAGTTLALSHAALAQTFPQAFDDIATLGAAEWFTKNNSLPEGNGYFQGNPAVFTAFASTGYLGVNFNSTEGDNTISNWFGTPALNLANGQQFTFYARTVTPGANSYPDRLQVRLSTNGFSSNVGTLPLDVGDFSTVLLDINPTLIQTPAPGSFPAVWTQYTITISGLGSPTVGRIAFRYFCTNGGPLGANSNYIGIDEATYNGSIAIPPTGACCREDGTCQVMTASACTSTFGIYRGDNALCGVSANCPSPYGFTGDDATVSNEVGDVLATAAPVNGFGQELKYLHGYVALGDRADIFKIQICDRTTFSATTVGNGNSLDTELALFDSTGKGITFCDDTGIGTVQSSAQSLITGQYVLSNGTYYLAVSQFVNTAPATASTPLDAAGQAIWIEPSPWNGTTGGAGWPEWAPNGPSVTKILAASPPAWNIDPDTFGSYTVALTGACFLGCYANCDESTSSPVLNANDFNCFLNKYAAGNAYANCDGSTASPVLNANDFNCFLNKYAAGCN